ncbi:hypothetical protein [Burkholderia cenocepacia]|uniref:hypothetical protein n=1 Tax=Burkholderia cenocepacia TaxID=95486 RepID=UPI002AB68F17|nr:hypothetical protein [Burkholderia cenocepacia]
MSSSWVSQAASEVGDYLWSGAAAVGDTVVGAVAGEFSQKRNTGAIIVDAVISMFPVAGEITAARDAIAIALRMCDDPKVRDDGWEWVALVLCLVAVVPVVGGLLKGIGKLLMRAVSKSEDLAKLCQEILALSVVGRSNFNWSVKAPRSRADGLCGYRYGVLPLVRVPVMSPASRP